MSPPVVLFGVLFLMILLGVPVAASLGVSAIVAIIAFNLAPLAAIPTIAVAAISNFTLLAVPFFIMAGYTMEKSGIAGRLVSLAELIVGRVRGGLAYVTIVVSIFFGGISGSGTADTAAIGSLLLPAMQREGYGKAFSAALVACGGSIGVIVPPSILLILYGSLVNASIGKLFIGGIVPGLMVAGALAAVSFLWVQRHGHVAALPEKPALRRDARQAIWGLLVPVIILGGIYGGVFTPTESAAVAAVYAILVGLVVFRELKLRQVPAVVSDTGVITSMAMVIVTGATLFSWTITRLGLSQGVTTALGGLVARPLLLIIALNVILIIAGMFLDAVSITFVFLPLFLPLLLQAHVNLIHFGELYTVNMAIGQVHPPLGVNLYVAGGLVRERLGPLAVAVLPFVAAEMAVLALLIAFPVLTTGLPTLLGVK